VALLWLFLTMAQVRVIHYTFLYGGGGQ
jgi:hypothetical protein